MSEVEFNYEGTTINIQCTHEEKMEEIIKRFASKVGKKEQDLYFLYGGNIIKEDLTFISQVNESDKKRNKMCILVQNKSQDEKDDEESLIKSKYIICPTCKENARILVENYKLEIYQCKNGHKIRDISIRNFEDTQNINEAKIKCQNCFKVKKSTSYNHTFFICFDCKKDLCQLCKSIHDKSHNIINYDEKFFTCDLHYENYISYCSDCKKDICTTCEMEHSGHNIITYGSILPNVKKIKEELNIFQNTIDKLKNDIKEIIDKLNSFVYSLDQYFGIYEDILNGYESKKRNYFLLKNIHDITTFNQEIIKDINTITSDNNISNKFNTIINVNNKINTSKNTDKENRSNDKINNNSLGETNKKEEDDNNKINKDKEDKNSNDNKEEKNENKIEETTKEETNDINPNNNNESKKDEENNDQVITYEKELFDASEKKPDNNYNNFNITKMEVLLKIKMKKMIIKNFFVLKDGRILIFGDDDEKNFLCFIIDIKNNSYFNLNVQQFDEIIQLDDGIVVLLNNSEILLITIKEKDFDIIQTIKIDSFNKNEKETIENQKIFKLSDSKILILLYKQIKLNNKGDKADYFFESLYFLYENKKLSFENSRNLNSTKNKLFFKDNSKIILINEKEIAMTYIETGLITNTCYLGFFDLENDKKIESIKLKMLDYICFCCCLINKNILIYALNGIIYSINLNNHSKKKAMKFLEGHSFDSVIALNEKIILGTTNSELQQFYLNGDNSLSLRETKKGHRSLFPKYKNYNILKYPKNRTFELDNNVLYLFG